MGPGYLKLKSLEIRNFRGVTPASGRFCLESTALSAGINLVYGANGSGKTTMAKAMEVLLWADKTESRRAFLSSTWTAGSARMGINCIAGVRDTTFAEGGGAEPAIPPLARAYALNLSELLEADDQDLAALIRKEMFGGVDLQGASHRLGFGSMPDGRNTAARELRSAKATVKTVAATQRELLARGRRLPELEAELCQARDARDRIHLLERLADCCSRRLELSILDDEIAGIRSRGIAPTVTSSLCDRLTEIVADLDSKSRDIEVQSALVTAQKDVCESVDMEEGTVPDKSRLSSLHARLAELKRYEAIVEQARSDQQAAGAAASSYRSFAGGTFSDQDNTALSLERIRLIKPAFDQWCSRLSRKEALESTLRIATDGLSSGPLPADSREVVDCLLQWLEAAGTEPAAKSGAIIPVAVAAVVAGLFSLLAILLNPWWMLGGVVPWAYVIISSTATGRKQGSEILHHLATRYAQFSDPPPVKEWSASAVSAALRKAQEQLVEECQDVRRRQRVEALRQELLDADSSATAARESLERTAAEHGLELGKELHPDWLVLAEAAVRYREALAKAAEADSRSKATDEAYAEELGRFNAGLADLTARRAEDSVTAQVLLEVLTARASTWTDAQAEIRQAEAQIRRLKHDVSWLKERGHEIAVQALGETDLSPRESLVELKRRLPDSEQLRKQLSRRDEMQRGLSEREAELRAMKQWKEELLDWPAERIASELSRNSSLADRYDPLHKEIVELQAQVAAAQAGNSLGAAIEHRRDAEGDLEQLATTAVENAVGKGILNYLRAAAGTSSSVILQKAQRLFARVTSNCYELVVEGEGSAKLSARDCRLGVVRQLDELSTATRIQLLLCVRMAFIETQEAEHLRPPLVLDEILANSDQERSEAVMKAVVEFAALGRQVFYFTAQSDELDKWRDLLDNECGRGIDWSVVVLPLGEDPPTRDPALKRLGEQPAVPLPGVESYDEYGVVLQAPPFPMMDAEGMSTPVFYLLDQPAELHALMQAGCQTWGQMQAMRRAGGESVFMELGVTKDERFAPAAEARFVLLAKLRRLYSQGRGLPVTADVVLDEESPVAHLKHAKAVAALAGELECDGRALIDALRNRRVRGFQKRKIEELEAWLQEEGYLDDRETLPIEELIVRTISECSVQMKRAGLGMADARRVIARALNSHSVHEPGYISL